MPRMVYFRCYSCGKNQLRGPSAFNCQHCGKRGTLARLPASEIIPPPPQSAQPEGSDNAAQMPQAEP